MEHQVTLVVGKNGSVEIIDEDRNSEPWGEFITLAVLMTLSLVLNLSLVGAGLLGRSKAAIELSHLIVTLVMSNALDSLVNHSLALVFITYFPSTSPSDTLCRLSAVSYVTALILQPSYILAYFLPVLYVQKWNSSRLFRYASLLGPPVVAGMISTPIIYLPNLIQVRYFINRHVCGIAGENYFYSFVLIILGFFSTWAAIAFFLIAPKLCETTANDDAEGKDLRYVLTMIAAAFILVLPAVTSFCIYSITTPSHLSTYRNNNDFVIITGTFDTVLTWTRFSFNVVSPVIIFVYFKDLRDECLLFNKSCLKGSHNVRRSKDTRSLGGPILFVTSKGLMLLANNKRPQAISKCDLVEEDRTSNPPSDPPKPQLSTELSPVPASEPKNASKKKHNKKIVRFAQSVLEIPGFPDSSV